MDGVALGGCQILFVHDRADVIVDLVLTGPGEVEGRPLVPFSPLAARFIAPLDPGARRRALKRLHRWAEAGAHCQAFISLGEYSAEIVLWSGGHQVVGTLTDLDVEFALPLRERQDD